MDPEIDYEFPSNAAIFRFVVAVVLLLWSNIIGPEQPGVLWDGPTADIAVEPTPTGGGKSLPQKSLGSKNAGTIDRDAFLISYKRQARQKLDACLQAWIPTPGRTTFVAVLHKKTGRLSNLEVIGTNKDLPGCVTTLTSEMDFAPLVEFMDGDNVVLQWTADW